MEETARQISSRSKFRRKRGISPRWRHSATEGSSEWTMCRSIESKHECQTRVDWIWILKSPSVCFIHRLRKIGLACNMLISADGMLFFFFFFCLSKSIKSVPRIIDNYVGLCVYNITLLSFLHAASFSRSSNRCFPFFFHLATFLRWSPAASRSLNIKWFLSIARVLPYSLSKISFSRRTSHSRGTESPKGEDKFSKIRQWASFFAKVDCNRQITIDTSDVDHSGPLATLSRESFLACGNRGRQQPRFSPENWRLRSWQRVPALFSRRSNVQWSARNSRRGELIN